MLRDAIASKIGKVHLPLERVDSDKSRKRPNNGISFVHSNSHSNDFYPGSDTAPTYTIWQFKNLKILGHFLLSIQEWYFEGEARFQSNYCLNIFYDKISLIFIYFLSMYSLYSLPSTFINLHQFQIILSNVIKFHPFRAISSISSNCFHFHPCSSTFIIFVCPMRVPQS